MNKAKQMVDEFIAKYPDAEYGAAHVVLGDYNFEDHFIDSAIVEVKATLDLLHALRAIPKNERVIDDA